MTKGKVSALMTFRGSEGAPERRIWVPHSLGQGRSGRPARLWEDLTVGCNGRIMRAKSDDGRELPHCELKWKIPGNTPGELSGVVIWHHNS